MRNLKRVLSLALALVMILGMMVVGASAAASADFVDADEITYTEAVDVLTGLGVLAGYDTGDFGPDDVLTRAQAAKILCYVMMGPTNAAKVNKNATIFEDVPATHWASGYIRYCTTLGILAGVGNNKFNPEGELTGVAFAKMLLVAAGYDAEAEDYLGNDWATNIAVDAIKYGIDVKGTVLSDDLTREQAAQMILQTLDIDTVSYKTGTVIGLVGPYATGKDFKATYFPGLTKTGKGNGDWGRPYDYKWTYTKAGKTSTLYTAWETPLATYVEPTKNCDIYYDTDLDKGDVLAVYTNSNTAVGTYPIADTQTTASVTKQGRLVEVYEECVVCIDTWLSSVKATTAEKVDANGHVTPATTTFDVYGVTGNIVVETSGYTVGQYALVTILDGEIVDITVTTATTVGVTKASTAATTTIGATTYADAYTLALGKSEGTTNVKTVNATASWDVFVDQYGNLIGAVPTTTNYLVVEAIRWIDANDQIFGGSALANIVLADGTAVKGVTIAKVGSNVATNGDNQDSLSNGYVSDSETQNGEYYNHIFTYTVNADGSYNIGGTHAGVDAFKVSIYEGITTVGSVTNTNTFVANNATVFLVKDKVGTDYGYTYTAYVGKNNVPNLVNATICYKVNPATGYATLVVVSEYDLAANSFVAYVSDNASTGTIAIGKGVYNVYDVWKLGETTATTVYASAGLIDNDKDGLYVLTVDDNNIVNTAKNVYFMGTYDNGDAGTSGNAPAPNSYDRAFANLPLIGGSLETTKKDGTTAFVDYYVDDAQYIVVTKDSSSGTDKTSVVAGSAANLTEDGKVVVVYTTTPNGVKVASYVYIIKAVAYEAPILATEAKVAFTLTVKSTHDEKEDVVYDLGSVTMTTGKATFVLNHNSKQVDWKDATATFANDKRATGLTLSQYIDPALGTEQVVEVKAADLGTEIEVGFVLYID